MKEWLSANPDADLVDLCMHCLRAETGVTQNNQATDLAVEVIEEELDKRGLLSEWRKEVKRLARDR